MAAQYWWVMVSDSNPHYRLVRLTSRLWDALCCETATSTPPSLSDLKQQYLESPSPQGWAVTDSRSPSIPLAAVWTIAERPQQWCLVWAVQTGEVSSAEVLLACLAEQAQRHNISHWRCVVQRDDDVLGGFLKNHGFRHIATQTQWQGTFIASTLTRNLMSAKTDDEEMVSSLCVARREDAWPIFELAKEACPLHARPYLMPAPPQWQQHLWQACYRFVRGGFHRQWVVQRPKSGPSSPLLGMLEISSQEYPCFTLAITLSDGWQQAMPALVNYLLAQTLQQASQPIVAWRTFSHQQELETILSERGFTPAQHQLVLARDVWTPLKPEKSNTLTDLLRPAEPTYGIARTSPHCHPNITR